MDLSKLRNIGISAHIDSGKTTLSERVLFYSGRIHRMQEVKGGGAGATMDHMDLERERGITITSAATSVEWNGYDINLIDTPGHVDFTVEVERSLRVLDGAILVLCAVGGVQAQSLTIDRQMRRYRVPRLAFINKMDRTGGNPQKVVEQLRGKLGCDAVLMQLPIGLEHNFEGVVDLLREEALYFDGDNGEDVRREPVPADMVEEVKAARQHLLEAVSMYSDEMMELLLAEENLPLELIDRVIREAVLSQQLTPVFLGSAYKNKGVQPLLDAVTRYLPSPLESPIKALAHDDPHKDVPLTPDPSKPMVGMGFKIVEDSYGTLTFMRVYQGTHQEGRKLLQPAQRPQGALQPDRADARRSARRHRYGRGRRHRRRLGTRRGQRRYLLLAVPLLHAGKHVRARAGHQGGGCPGQARRRRPPEQGPAPLPPRRSDAPYFDRRRDQRNDHGRHGRVAPGNLHRADPPRVRRGSRGRRPKVNYREAPTQACKFNTKHKKQTGGSGQYAHIVGRMEPLPEDSPETFVFEEEVAGGRIPKNFIPAVEKGFRQMVHKGPVAGYPVVGLKVTLEDGSYHDVDSSDMAFQTCARTCMRENFPATRPVLLEPVMKIEIECPTDFQGSVVGNLTSRRGMVVATEVSGAICRIEGEVPLAETFGYSTDLRSMTQGQGTFTMEFAKYRRMPGVIEREVIAARKLQASMAEV